MVIQPGVHKLGSDNATLQVRTYRQGLASKAGHDLVIEVTRWEATVSVGEDWAGSTVELTADPRSLEVREGLHGIKPLRDKDRADIRETIDTKVLRGQPITFRSTDLKPAAAGAALSVSGDLAMAGTTGPVSFQLTFSPDGRVAGVVVVTQSDWGIKPYSAMMGALKVRDTVEVVLDAGLPAG